MNAALSFASAVRSASKGPALFGCGRYRPQVKVACARRMDVLSQDNHHTGQCVPSRSMPSFTSRYAAAESRYRCRDYLFALPTFTNDPAKACLGHGLRASAFAARYKSTRNCKQIIDSHTEPWGIKVQRRSKADRPARQEMQRAWQTGGSRTRTAYSHRKDVEFVSVEISRPFAASACRALAVRSTIFAASESPLIEGLEIFPAMTLNYGRFASASACFCHGTLLSCGRSICFTSRVIFNAPCSYASR